MSGVFPPPLPGSGIQPGLVIPCRGCGQSINRHATKCPHCATPLRKAQNNAWLLIALIFAPLVAWALGLW